jgi:hypothetical protein
MTSMFMTELYRWGKWLMKIAGGGRGEIDMDVGNGRG